jgi:hypothetical protein
MAKAKKNDPAAEFLLKGGLDPSQFKDLPVKKDMKRANSQTRSFEEVWGEPMAKVSDKELDAIIKAAKKGDDDAIFLIAELKKAGRVSMVKGSGGGFDIVKGQMPSGMNVIPEPVAAAGPAPATVATPQKSSWEGVAFSSLNTDQTREVLEDAARGNQKAIALRDALEASGRVQQAPTGAGGRMEFSITPEAKPEVAPVPAGRTVTPEEAAAREEAGRAAEASLEAAKKPATPEVATIGPERGKALQQFAMDRGVPLDEIQRMYGVKQLSDIPDQRGIEQAVQKLIEERQTKRATSGAGLPAISEGSAPTGQAVEAVKPTETAGRIVRVPGGVERNVEQDVRLGVLRKRNIGQMFGNRRDQDALIKNTFGFNASSMKKGNPEAYRKLGEIAEALQAIKSAGDIGPSHPRMQAMEAQVKVIKDSFRGGMVNTGAKGWDSNINSAHRAVLTNGGKIRDELYNYTMDEVGLGRGSRRGRTPATVPNPNARQISRTPELGTGTPTAGDDAPEIRTGGGVPTGQTLGGAEVGGAAAAETPEQVAAADAEVKKRSADYKAATAADPAKYGAGSGAKASRNWTPEQSAARKELAAKLGYSSTFTPPSRKAAAAPAAPAPAAGTSKFVPPPSGKAAAPAAPAPAAPTSGGGPITTPAPKTGRIAGPWPEGKVAGPWPEGPEMGPATAATEAAAAAAASKASAAATAAAGVEPDWAKGVAGPMQDASKYGTSKMGSLKNLGGKALSWLGPLFAIYGVYETLNMLNEGTIGKADEDRLKSLEAFGAMSQGMGQDLQQRQMMEGMQRMVDLAAIQRQQSLDQMRNQYTGNQAMDALLRGQQASLAALAQPSRPSIAEMMARM